MVWVFRWEIKWDRNKKKIQSEPLKHRKRCFYRNKAISFRNVVTRLETWEYTIKWELKEITEGVNCIFNSVVFNRWNVFTSNALFRQRKSCLFVNKNQKQKQHLWWSINSFRMLEKMRFNKRRERLNGSNKTQKPAETKTKKDAHTVNGWWWGENHIFRLLFRIFPTNWWKKTLVPTSNQTPSCAKKNLISESYLEWWTVSECTSDSKRRP